MAHFTTSERYLCVTIDSNAMRNHWGSVNLTNPLLVTLAKGLGPTTLRVGGTAQDFGVFVPSNKTIPKYNWLMKRSSCTSGLGCVEFSTFNISEHDWDVLNEFVKTAGWELVFGLSISLQNSDGSWDSRNAEELVKYTMTKGYSLLGWELGNGEEKYLKFFVLFLSSSSNVIFLV